MQRDQNEGVNPAAERRRYELLALARGLGLSQLRAKGSGVRGSRPALGLRVQDICRAGGGRRLGRSSPWGA